MVSFTLLHLYHGSDEDDVSLFVHMYILLSLSYPMTCIVDNWAFWINYQDEFGTNVKYGI